jgi:hypothetical protein
LPVGFLVGPCPLPDGDIDRSACSTIADRDQQRITMNRRLVALSVLASTALAGSAVVATAGPAAAACDSMSVGTPNKSGSNVRSSASICAATNWTAYVSIERWRGTWWDTIGSEQAIRGAGAGVVRQGPISRGCGGTGTYTYRGKIWMTNGISFTADEYSAKHRFSC